MANQYTKRNAARAKKVSKAYQKTHDSINHPSHYNSHPSGVECITITEHMTNNIGNAIKYLWRADGKNGVEDLKKAAWYVNREIQRIS